MKYALCKKSFESDAHEKAWLIRVTINACRDLLGSFFKTREVPLDEALQGQCGLTMDNRYVLEAVLRLPEKYKNAVYLHYYEGYTAKEIGSILHRKESAVYTLLHRARNMLRAELEENHGKEDHTSL